MKVKLHRCKNLWIKVGAHPCWQVQRELDAAGVDYEVVPGPVMRHNRKALEELSGQRRYPVIEFDSGEVYREEAKDMAARIKEGALLGAKGHAHALAHPHEMHDTESL
jgi:hypothetical protein